MNPRDAEEYTQALGQIVAGGWRQIALGQKLGVPKALELTTKEWVEQRLGGYVRLASVRTQIEERREAVRELHDEGHSNRGIAAVLGVDEGTIRTDLAELDAENSASDDGEPPTQAEAEELPAENSAQPLDVVAALATSEAIREQAAAAERIALLTSSESAEWYTPAEYLEAVRDVLGGIDLDPASSKAANEVVKAECIYTAADNGLEQPWHGRVFLNPPYGRQICGAFVSKALNEHAGGRTSATVLLLNGFSYDASWFRPLWDHLLCFTYGRIPFWAPERTAATGTNGSVFVYLGPDGDRFATRFSEVGAVLARWPR